MCYYHYLLSSKGHELEEMISHLFQHCDVYFEDVNVNCDPEHVLNCNRRSSYEQFHFIHSYCTRKI